MTVEELVPAALAGERLDRVVAMITGRSRAEVAQLVAAGAVRVGGRTVTTRSAHVAHGDRISVDLPREEGGKAVAADPSVAVEVVHEDGDLLVLDKPPGLVVHPGAGRGSGTLVQGLLARYPELREVGEPHRPGIVHRLDKGTSGLLLVARTPAAHETLVADLAARRVRRCYRTLVWGEVASPRGLVDAPVGRAARDRTRMTVSEVGKPARTRYEVLAVHHRPCTVTELRCSLETGRTHQIRVHLSSIGHPVVGDARYGGARQSLPLRRPFLHAASLALDHPRTGEPLRFTSPLPPDLRAVLDTLE